MLAACSGETLPDPTAAAEKASVSNTTAAEGQAWFKDSDPFIVRSGGLEARLENMQGVTTPNRLFFVRNNSKSIGLDTEAWRLSVQGDAVSNPLEMSYEDLRNMPSKTVIAYLECAGNQRAMFKLVNGRTATGTQWERGAVSNGEWTGVSLWNVLELAGITSEAISVLLVGLDKDSPEGGFRRVIPIDKAMHPDTLLAYSLNGETLPEDHGFPLRAVVPGWVGSSWIKWVGRIVVSSEQLWTRNNTTSYVLAGDNYPSEGRADGTVITTQVIKSALALPWPTQLTAGSHRIHGFAHSPHPITEVEWSDNSGATWNLADLHKPLHQHSWTRFEFTWVATLGEHTLTTRATDTTGNTQPDFIPFNRKGYLFNQPLPHPLTVT